MPNEFIIKNGYRSQGNSEITGSLTVTAGITGSFFGTSSWANNATTSSFALNGGSPPFPYTGSAQITGSLTVIGPITTTGSLFSSNLSGSGDRILLASSNGQITSSTQTIISAYIDPLGTAALLLNSNSNWDINGEYIGTGITGTFQGQNHYNSNYFYTAVDDNSWIRLIRG